MKKYLNLLLFIPLLIGCKQTYNGPKISLQKSDNPGLIVVTGEHMFDEAFTNKVDSIYYIGDDTCSACQELKPLIQSWCNDKQTNIYEIKYAEITEAEQRKIEDATVGYYAWTKENTLPAVYFFMEGEVVFVGDNRNTIKNLDKYVQVI